MTDGSVAGKGTPPPPIRRPCEPAALGVGDRIAIGAFTTATLANAALLFLLEPMASKQVLPLLGGSSAVWTTCMLFYQGLLLAGYAYAHVSTQRLGLRRAAAMHLGVFSVSLLALPVTLNRGWSPPPEGTPVVWLLRLMTVSIGVPFLCLSAGAPLLQRWFAGTGHPRRDDPYFLYAASNAGSMAALLAYPLVIEPRLTLKVQSHAWSAAYVALGFLLAVCATAVWRARPGPAALPGSGATFQPVADRIGSRRRAWWVALSAVPSSLLLGVTAHLSTDVAPVPLLWVLPLALYLLTFVWAFSPRRRAATPNAARATRLLALPLVVALAFGWSVPLPLAVAWELTVFTLLAAVCHARLAAERPEVSGLTEYFVWISAGGMLGGAFNALAAPLLFRGLYEYPIALVLAIGLASAGVPHDAQRRPVWHDAMIAAALGAVAWVVAGAVLGRTGANNPLVNVVLGGAGAVALLACAERPLRLTLASAAAFLGLARARAGADGVVLRTRSFYGTYRVQQGEAAGRRINVLMHGSTVHGAQFTEPALAREPLTYYARSGPVGDAFAALPARITSGRIAAVGLGTGSLACYKAPGARWTFLEIDPEMVRIASASGRFDFLARCAPDAGVLVGDARLVLARVPDRAYDLLVLDAFTSDAVPTHLLTAEAFAEYTRLLSPGGVLLVHVSNRYLRLDRVVAAAAGGAGMQAWTRRSAPEPAERERMVAPAQWIALGRDQSDLGGLVARAGWRRIVADGAPWRDDFSNIVGIIGAAN
jgi:SAM-dependent methyltransferase